MKMKSILLAAAALMMSFAVSSCGQKQVPANSGSEEIILPFADFVSDTDFFRSVGSGVSIDMATAKKIATLNARTELAGSVSSVIKAVTEQYTNQMQIEEKQEFAAKFEETTRNVVNQELAGVIIKDQKAFKGKDGKFTYYVAVEMPKQQIVDEVANAITKDKKLALEFDKFQFQKTFEAEMAKLEQNK